jgi:sec-independent protein translocase protein TatA
LQLKIKIIAYRPALEYDSPVNLPGPFELLLIFLVALLVFGANRLPEIARSLGETVREFKKAINISLTESDDEPKK